MNIKLIPNEWTTKRIPITVIQHRLLQTDPIYKFVFNAVVHVRSNISQRRDSNNNNYYDLLNMSVSQDTAISPYHWLDYINNAFNLNIQVGSSVQSSVFPELVFDSVDDKNLFDGIYEMIKNDQAFVSEGVNVLLDFDLRLSGGFIRNKLNIDTNEIKNWILDGISFSLLKIIMEKNSVQNFQVKEIYKLIYNLNKYDIELLETIFKKINPTLPSENNNIFWNYLDKYKLLDLLSSKQALFNFKFGGVILSEVNSKEVSFSLDQYNRPKSIITQMKYDNQQERVYITRSSPSLPVSTNIRGGYIKVINVPSPEKNIQTKINNHIYMVNKK